MGYRASAHRRYAAKRLRKQIVKRWVRIRPYMMWALGAAIVIGGVGMFFHRLFFASRFVIETVRFAPGATAMVTTTGHLDMLTEQRTDTNYYLSRYWHLRGVRKRAKKQYPMIRDISLAYGGSATAHADVTYHRPSMYVIVGSGALSARWVREDEIIDEREATHATTDIVDVNNENNLPHADDEYRGDATEQGRSETVTGADSLVPDVRDDEGITASTDTEVGNETDNEKEAHSENAEDEQRVRVWGVESETIVLGLYGDGLVPLVASAVQIREGEPVVRVSGGFGGLGEDDWAVFFGELDAQDVRDDMIMISEQLGEMRPPSRETGEPALSGDMMGAGDELVGADVAPLQIYYMPGVYRSIVTLQDGSELHLSHTREIDEQLAVYQTIMADPSIVWVDAPVGGEADAQAGDMLTQRPTRIKRPISRLDLGSSPSQAFVVFGDEE